MQGLFFVCVADEIILAHDAVVHVSAVPGQSIDVLPSEHVPPSHAHPQDTASVSNEVTGLDVGRAHVGPASEGLLGSVHCGHGFRLGSIVGMK